MLGEIIPLLRERDENQNRLIFWTVIEEHKKDRYLYISSCSERPGDFLMGIGVTMWVLKLTPCWQLFSSPRGALQMSINQSINTGNWGTNNNCSPFHHIICLYLHGWAALQGISGFGPAYPANPSHASMLSRYFCTGACLGQCNAMNNFPTKSKRGWRNGRYRWVWARAAREW